MSDVFINNGERKLPEKGQTMKGKESLTVMDLRNRWIHRDGENPDFIVIKAVNNTTPIGRHYFKCDLEDRMNQGIHVIVVPYEASKYHSINKREV